MATPLQSAVSKALVIAIVTAALVGGIRPNASAIESGADVRAYGATGDGATDDTAAIQRANDAVAAHGGGKVYFAPGTYIAAGIQQDAGVELTGTRDAVLKHPDGLSGPVVTNRRKKTTGSIVGASQVVTVSNATGVAPGRRLTIQAADGASEQQHTTLAQPMAQVGDPLAFTRNVGFPSEALVLVDQEVIAYARSSSGAIRTSRAQLGTQAEPHAAGAKLSMLRNMAARVVSVAGNRLTLDRPAAITVQNAAVYFSTDDLAITNLTIDGNKPGRGSPTSDTVPVEYRLVQRARIADSFIRDGDHGAISLDTFSSDSVIEGNVLMNNGSPLGTHGAGIWLFRGATGNVVRDNVIGGDAFHGIFADDRSQGASMWDGPCDGNTIERNTIEIPHVDPSNAGILMVGSSGNTIRQNTVRFATQGIRVETSEQGIGSPLDARSNYVEDNVLISNRYPIRVTGSNNRFVGNLTFLATFPSVDDGEGNVFEPKPVSDQTIVTTQANTAVVASPLARNRRTMRATLTNTTNSTPLAGRTLTFTSRGAGVCSATTGSNGQATCSLRAKARSRLAGTFTASFAGDADSFGSAGTAAIKN